MSNSNRSQIDVDTLNEFKHKLANLLEQYGIDGICLDWADCSDMSGVYDERVVITDKSGEPIGTLCAGFGVEVKDLK